MSLPPDDPSPDARAALDSPRPRPSYIPPPDVDVRLRVVHRPIPLEAIDPDAAKVLNRLERFGYEAYLVGGCVRDILLGRAPKDFDVATSARPREVKRIFRNCRLIGRRFRLAHLLFANRKIIEVATFRRGATEEDDVSERHAAENLFGSAQDDAVRRDFTVNALMYDIRRGEIRDWVGGLDDLERRVLRTIGQPDRRFVEDPVRIIRAVKFSVKLGLVIEPPVLDAMIRHAALVSRCAPARLTEEIMKLLRSGASARALALVHQIGALGYLVPRLEEAMRDAGDPRGPLEVLERADEAVRRGEDVSDAILVAALFFPLCREAVEGGGDVSRKLADRLQPGEGPVRFNRRQLAGARQIFVSWPVLLAGPRARRARRLLGREYAGEAVRFFALAAQGEERETMAEEWRRALLSRERPAERPCDSGTPGGERRRRRWRRRRRSGDEGGRDHQDPRAGPTTAI